MREGGWKVVTNATPSPLPFSYRHFGANLSSPATFALPYAQSTVGRPMLPLGHQIHVHNVGAQTITVNVATSGGFFSSHAITAGKSCGFTLIGYDDVTRAGYWVMHRTDFANVSSGITFPDGFRAELSVDGMVNHYNILEQVVARGYDGTMGALVIVTLAPDVIVGGTTNLLPSFDTGGDAAIGGVNWHASSALFLRIPDTAGIHGCPGNGGKGGTGGTGSSAVPGTDGGIALRAGFSITVSNLGRIAGGCGGGGGGDGQVSTVGLNGGGGGGGAGANIWRGGVAKGGKGGAAGGTGAQAGSMGTVLNGGSYGFGSTVGANVGGRGGNGGGYGGAWVPSAGSPGRTLNDAGNGQAGGAVGAAVSRKSAVSVVFTPWSTGYVGGSTIVVG